MCGVFGFIATGRRGPNIDQLRSLAVVNASRGHDAFGLVWLHRNGSLHTYKREGSIVNRLRSLDRVEDAQVVFGHCRWMTNGSPAESENNHPHPSGRGYIVHNGTVANHRWLARAFAIRPRGECDSEVLGRLIARLRGPLSRRAETAMILAEGPQAVLGVWPGVTPRLLIARKGKPLHVGGGREGIYLGSLAAGLRSPEAIDDGSVSVTTVASWLGLNLTRSPATPREKAGQPPAA